MTDQLLDKAHRLVGDLTTAEQERDEARAQLDGLRLAIEQILDSTLGPDEWDGTGQGIVADVALLAEQRNTLVWLHAEAKHQLGEAQAEISDLRDRARRVRENEHVGYIEHLNDLTKALGQHADPTARSLHQLIDRDVTALREAYDTIEEELVEWRTGQRAVEASVMQWGEVTGKLDETLAAVRKLVQHFNEDAQREQLQGELPADEPVFPAAGLRAVGTDLDGRTVTGIITGFFAWNDATNTNDRAGLQLDDGQETVVTTASLQPAEPLKFTHDTEE